MFRLASHEDEEISFPLEASKALEQMMKLYGTVVLRTAYFYMGDLHLAEDISQEVFLRAYRNWDRFRGGSRVKTWLTKITSNLCKDRLSLKASKEQPTDPLLLRQQQFDSAEKEALQKINATNMLKLVIQLPASYHEVVYLYYYLDLSTKEIAVVMDTPEGTVRGRLHRAREMLKGLMGKEGLAHEL